MHFDEVLQEFTSALSKLSESTRQTLQEAFELAASEHSGQLRKEHKGRAGQQDPYLIHPLRVTLILINELGLSDLTALAAALLHDVVEDGHSCLTIEDIAGSFGREVAETVHYLTKPKVEAGISEAVSLRPYHESFRTAPLAVRLVKLADRLDNMREAILVDKPVFQSRYLSETREIYLPLARQTSLVYAVELEALCHKLENVLVINSGANCRP
jgi:(p)ppGpp synthase/HD superfamily hydrolase